MHLRGATGSLTDTMHIICTIGAALYAAAGTLHITLTFLRPIPAALRLIWIVSIAGPAFVISALFLLNWLKRGEIHARGKAGSK